ncbi:lipid A deacylase LpxR family protein [Vibrio taketomensis]|uniref:lipid A deacylase LpxR family protein n=1 Tax=Vibrio taketomensis TaxID=2572923 RepID=UPI001389C3A3|nr:lipid A deacylase LpxR family protein [Vibrio taketomensis]
MKTQIGITMSLLLGFGAQASDKSTLFFNLDNDGLFGTDYDYTSGIFLGYTSGSLSKSHRLEALSLSSSSTDKWEFVFGQKMYTPEDIYADTPIANDRPYAGILFSEINYLSIESRQVTRYNFTIGTVGENSYARQAQEFVHELTGSMFPNGWEYQIDEGLVASIGYQRHATLYRNSHWEIANISEANGGNFRSDITTGFMFRWGNTLNNNLGAANIDTERVFRPGLLTPDNHAWFMFVGAKGGYRFNDVTIEGDRPAIEDPHNYPITLQHWQASAVTGIVWYNQNYGISLSLALKSKEYQQAPRATYGNASFAMFYFL